MMKMIRHKVFCPDCCKAVKGTQACNLPDHINYRVHHSYRVPGKSNKSKWNKIKKAAETGEPLPLTEGFKARKVFSYWSPRQYCATPLER